MCFGWKLNAVMCVHPILHSSIIIIIIIYFRTRQIRYKQLQKEVKVYKQYEKHINIYKRQ